MEYVALNLITALAGIAAGYALGKSRTMLDTFKEGMEYAKGILVDDVHRKELEAVKAARQEQPDPIYSMEDAMVAYGVGHPRELPKEARDFFGLTAEDEESLRLFEESIGGGM